MTFTFADVIAAAPSLDRTRQETLAILHLLELPAAEFDPQLAFSFGDAVILWTYAEMRRCATLNRETILRLLQLWGPELRDAINGSTILESGGMEPLVIAVVDRRYARAYGLQPQPRAYDLVDCQWLQDEPPAAVEGLTYNLTALARRGRENLHARRDKDVRGAGRES